jgi:hypothetical protein
MGWFIMAVQFQISINSVSNRLATYQEILIHKTILSSYKVVISVKHHHQVTNMDHLKYIINLCNNQLAKSS